MLGLGLGLTASARQGGSSFSPLSLSPLAWARTPAPTAAPVSCSITLTGDAAALIPNGAAMTIVGQTASYTRTDDTTNWIATTNPAVPYMPPASSTVIAEIGLTQAGLALTEARITTMDLQSWAIVGNTPVFPGKWVIGVIVSGSNVYANTSVDDTAIIALGVDATGSPAIFVDGSPLDLGGAGSGVFSSGFGLMAYDEADPGNTSGSGSVTFRTAAADMQSAYPAGTLDWCGNSIEVVDGLYQDSAGTTPVTGAGQDVGLREDQSGNSADFTQATATARPTYETSPARLEYDVDDALSCTLPAISGGQIVIISPAGTWIDDFDFAGGTFTVGPGTYTGGPAGLMSLLGNEEIEIIILPTPMTAAERAKMVSYAQGLGSAGLITLNADESGSIDFTRRVDANWTDNLDGTFTSNGGSGFVGDTGALFLDVGAVYEITFEVTSRTAGSVRPQNTSGTSYYYANSNGVKRQLVACNSNAFYFYSNSFNGTVELLSLKKVVMP